MVLESGLAMVTVVESLITISRRWKRCLKEAKARDETY